MKFGFFSRGKKEFYEDPYVNLMLRYRNGDEAAFEELVEKFKAPVFNFVYRQIGNLSEAEDIAQNVFVRVAQNAHTYEPTAKFTTWLFTIARNLCLNEFRRQKRHATVVLEEESSEDMERERTQLADPEAKIPSQDVVLQEVQGRILGAIQKLPENQRTALLLSRYEGQSYEEISLVLDLSVSAVKSLLHRARETLKLELKDLLDET